MSPEKENYSVIALQEHEQYHSSSAAACLREPQENRLRRKIKITDGRKRGLAGTKERSQSDYKVVQKKTLAKINFAITRYFRSLSFIYCFSPSLECSKQDRPFAFFSLSSLVSMGSRRSIYLLNKRMNKLTNL